MPVERSFIIESWAELVAKFAAYQPEGSYSMAECDHARHIATYLPHYAPAITHLGDRPSALHVAISLVNLYRDYPLNRRDSRLGLASFANQEQLDDEETRLMSLHGLSYLLDSVLGPAMSEYIMGIIHAERSVLWLRVNSLAQKRSEILSLTPTDTLSEIVIGETHVRIYRGRDGCGRFDAERLTLRPAGSFTDNQALFLAESDDAVGLRTQACFAPLDVAIHMLDDVTAHWPDYTLAS
jgi:hypothetical protein